MLREIEGEIEARMEQMSEHPYPGHRSAHRRRTGNRRAGPGNAPLLLAFALGAGVFWSEEKQQVTIQTI